MTDRPESERATNAASSRPFPRPLLRTLAIDVALPWLAVQLLWRFWNVPLVPALAIGAAFPAA